MAKQTNSELLHEIDKKVAILSTAIDSLTEKTARLEKAVNDKQVVTPENLHAYMELHGKTHEIIDAKVKDHDDRIDVMEKTEKTLYKNVTIIVFAGLIMMVLAKYGLDKFFRL